MAVDLMMVDSPVAIKGVIAVEQEGPGLSLAVVRMLKSCSDYLCDLFLVAKSRDSAAAGCSKS